MLTSCLGEGQVGSYNPVGFEVRFNAVLSQATQDERAFLLKLLAVDWGPEKWTQASLAEEALIFEQLLKTEYPELDHSVVGALANRWSYGWR
jgi:hypothetical protein